nr:hypothetical protein [Allomuricauda sp.]
MAVLLLLSTISWTVDKHMCMGRVMDISLFTEAHDCGMEEALKVSGMENMEIPCCEDDSFTMSGQDDLKLTWSDLDVEDQVLLIAFSYSYLNLFVPLEELPAPHEEYPPPKLVRDVQILDQVFLI